jgi:hypothetical protein
MYIFNVHFATLQNKDAASSSMAINSLFATCKRISSLRSF